VAGDANNDVLRPATIDWRAVRRHRDAVRAMVEELSDETVEWLAARAEEASAPDGYPSASGSGLGVSGSGGELTSVEAAAAADAPPDPVLERIAEVAAQLGEMAGLAKGCRKRLAFVRNVRVRPGLEASTGVCPACEEWVSGVGSDRFHSGFCNACSQLWYHYARAHPGTDQGELRVRFVRERKGHYP
jgi:hypothetical protein